MSKEISEIKAYTSGKERIEARAYIKGVRIEQSMIESRCTIEGEDFLFYYDRFTMNGEIVDSVIMIPVSRLEILTDPDTSSETLVSERFPHCDVLLSEEKYVGLNTLLLCDKTSAKTKREIIKAGRLVAIPFGAINPSEKVKREAASLYCDIKFGTKEPDRYSMGVIEGFIIPLVRAAAPERIKERELNQFIDDTCRDIWDAGDVVLNNLSAMINFMNVAIAKKVGDEACIPNKEALLRYYSNIKQVRDVTVETFKNSKIS